MVVIIDYDCGNVASVANMIRRAGGTAKVSWATEDIQSASALVLPGVGSFDHGMRQLRSRGLDDLLRRRVAEGTPLLGICLGMQLLALRSEEGSEGGLGLIRARFRRFADHDLPVPHVGWNKVAIAKDNALLPRSSEDRKFYFVHSYYAECDNDADVLCSTEYGGTFTSGYSAGNVYGVQFHPEKSHRFGVELFEHFLEVAGA